MKPTPSELEILNVLWRLGPATVRTVHTELERDKPIGYTTVLKLMQIMAEKGLVLRDESQKAHVYRPALEQAQAQSTLLKQIRDALFGGSSAQLVLHALSDERCSPEEIAEIRKLLDRNELDPDDKAKL